MADNKILVGYYDASAGQGVNTQITAISKAGFEHVRLETLSDAELENLNIILAQNPSNSNLGNELWSNKSNIAEAVDDGKVFILHDRYVGDRVEQFLPGFGRTDGIYRDFSRGKDINFAYEPLKTGKGGTLNDQSLDNGNWSSHGYADVNKLPEGYLSLLNTGIAKNAVTFAYSYGEGGVVYSSIPMDFYLNGSGPANLRGPNGNMNKYLTNLLELAGTGDFGGVLAPDPEFTIALVGDSGFDGDKITNNGSIVFDGIGKNDEFYKFFVNDVERGGPFGINNPLTFTDNGEYNLDVKTYKFLNGNYLEQDGASLKFTLDTVVEKATTGLKNGTDTGKYDDDNYTNKVSFATANVEEGAEVQYQIFKNIENGVFEGGDWGASLPDQKDLTDGSYTIWTKQTDIAGNTHEPTKFNFTLDTLRPDAPELILKDNGEDTNDRVTGDGRINIEGTEKEATLQYKNGNGDWTEVKDNTIEVKENGRYNIEVQQVDLAGNISDVESIEFAKRDLVFTHRLLEADGITEANQLEIASWGSKADKNRQYVLEISAESLADIAVEDLDLKLNFNNSLFEVVKAEDIQITSKLPLANSALVSDDNGGVRIAAGSASGLGKGAGEGIQDKSSVLRLLVDLKDNAYREGDYTELLNKDGKGALTQAGIEISANLDETVFADLSTLRDRGGVEAYQTLSQDIAVSRAETKLTEEKADPIVFGTERSIGGKTFTNLIRQGDFAIGKLGTWSNEGEAAATNVNLSIKQAEGYRLELKVGDEIGKKINVDDINITREYDGTISNRETMDVELKLTAMGPAGHVIDLDNINYKVESAGGYSWDSENLRTTRNLITYKGDLNYDGRVSMKDLAFLNAGAKQVEDGKSVARDVDANLDGEINMNDLAVLDGDWGKSLHEGKDKFLGSEEITMDELMQQGDVKWADDSFKTQNALETTNDFEATLDAPMNVGVIDGDGNAKAGDDIQGDYYQDDIGLA